MKINIIKAKYTGHAIVKRLKELKGTENSLDLLDIKNPENYNENEVNILVFDYTPIIQGDILIKYPGTLWKKLSINSKIFNTIKKEVQFTKNHISVRSCWISAVQRSTLVRISLTSKN